MWFNNNTTFKVLGYSWTLTNIWGGSSDRSLKRWWWWCSNKMDHMILYDWLAAPILLMLFFTRPTYVVENKRQQSNQHHAACHIYWKKKRFYTGGAPGSVRTEPCVTAIHHFRCPRRCDGHTTRYEGTHSCFTTPVVFYELCHLHSSFSIPPLPASLTVTLWHTAKLSHISL